jgi:hypothetical protein
MDSALQFRQKHLVDTEDLACQFMEDEVGRLDFRTNWKKLKETNNVRQRIQQWLEALNTQGDPDAIIQYLDKLVAQRAGNWL